MKRFTSTLCWEFFPLALTLTSALLPPSSLVSAAASPQPWALPDVVQQALQWERDQWTDGNVSESAFYKAPNHSSTSEPGSLLKLEEVTNTSAYALPPATALSRFIYQSESLNGTRIPVSAYILWPYAPRESADGYQVVAWAHGTSGLAPNTAPSHHKNLWQHFLAPYNLALQGYVVVATDYAGLGVGKTATGQAIPHEYLAAPAHANDIIFSVQAAQQAFPQLGKQFVVVGHSQGGAAAWSVAQRQVDKPARGYLGAVAVAPVTSILKEVDPVLSISGLGIIPGIASYFPGFQISDVCTPDGLERYALIKALEATTSTIFALAAGVQLLKSNWTENRYVRKYQQLIQNGDKPIAKPLLVIKGEEDTTLQYSVLVDAVHKTQGSFPRSSIEFIHMPGISHDPALTSSQRYWIDWIDDRFSGKDANPGPSERQVKPARPLSSYQPEVNWYLSIATTWYQTG